MGTLMVKWAIPLTIISLFIFEKWWFILPEDAPDTMCYGFPFMYNCNGWHTSMSIQIFVLEFLLDFVVVLSFWFAVVFFINRMGKARVNTKWIYRIYWVFAVLIIVFNCLIMSVCDTEFKITRDFKMQVINKGYRFTWQHMERPIYNGTWQKEE